MANEYAVAGAHACDCLVAENDVGHRGPASGGVILGFWDVLMTTRIALAGAVVTMGLMVCLDSWSGLRNTAHDFSTASWNTTGESCAPCHTPHSALPSSAPLWNRRETTSSFTLYSSDTLDAQSDQLFGTSKGCLSCHDGTVALNAFGGNMGDVFIEGRANLGTDLSDDHPIAIKYDSALASQDTGLFDPSTTSVPALNGQSIQESMLFEDYLECSSCHDVHASRGDSAWSEKLLVVDNGGSALCLTCHNK